MKEKKFLKIFILAAAIMLTAKILFDFNSFTGIFAYVEGIIRPFIFGFIIAYCINIPVTWLEKKLLKIKWKWMRKGARPISILANLFGLAGFIFFGTWQLIPMVIDNAQQLISELPGFCQSFMRSLKDL